MRLDIIRKITYAVFIILMLVVIFSIKSILKPVFFSALIAYILNPFVKYMSFKGINKKLAAIISIILLLAAGIFIIFFLIPGMMKDLIGAINSFDKYTDKIISIINSPAYNKIPKYFKDILDNNIVKLEGVSKKYLNEMFKQTIEFTKELPTYILAPVFIYYFLVDTDFFLNLIKMLVPANARTKLTELGRDMDKIIGGFIRSQIILSIVIMVLTFFVLIFFKIRYPVIIAFINGAANIIPYFGPIIGMLPAVLAALSESGSKAIIIIIAFLVIQQIESSLIAPKVMGDSIGIHPVFVMIILLVGGKYFGALGLIFSIPVGGILKVSWNYLIKNLY